MQENPPKNFEKEMAVQLSGFRTLGRVRSFFYKAAAVTALIAGTAAGAKEGAQKGITTAFIGLIAGLAGVRLLSAPIAVYLWFQNWKCPNCGKRLGRQMLENCPNCNAKIFDTTVTPSSPKTYR